MAIHWQIKFRSLRANTLYTVNIYDGAYSGEPVPLTGAATPFETTEDDDDDFFLPVRTQSGYLRIVDTGNDANGNVFNWRDLIPTTDTDRPVTLTDGGGAVVWQGFMQAQNFGGRLYEVPQEREFPLQCALAALSCVDIEAEEFMGMANFAALMNYAIECIPTLSFSHIIVQGGADAQQWLMKRFDWQLFSELNESGRLVGQYDIAQVMEHVCRYWGWTWRISGQKIYLVCPDDTTLHDFLVLTRNELYTLGGGMAAGTISDDGYNTKTISDEMAGIQNTDIQLRGCNQASVTSSAGDMGADVISCYPDDVMGEMYRLLPFGYSNVTYGYSQDLSSFSDSVLLGEAYDNGSFNILQLVPTPLRDEQMLAAVRCKAAYSGNVMASLQSARMHNFADGYLEMKAKIYKNGEAFDDAATDTPYWGNKHMTMRIGIGKTRASAYWWEGDRWSYFQNTFFAKIGSRDDTLWTCRQKGSGVSVYGHIETTDSSATSVPLPIFSCYGYIFVDFLGSDDIDNDESKRDFDIIDFSISFHRKKESWRRKDTDRRSSCDYKAKNDSMVRKAWASDTMFCTDNYSKFGPGVVANMNNTYFKSWNYTAHQDSNSTYYTPPDWQPSIDGTMPPEQHTAVRVATFWSKSRRKIEADVRKEAVADITPRTTLTIDGTTIYPVSVGHNWRDDVLKIVGIEINT